MVTKAHQSLLMKGVQTILSGCDNPSVAPYLWLSVIDIFPCGIVKPLASWLIVMVTRVWLYMCSSLPALGLFGLRELIFVLCPYRPKTLRMGISRDACLGPCIALCGGDVTLLFRKHTERLGRRSK